MMNSASVVPCACAQTFPVLMIPTASPHRRVRTHAVSKSALGCRVARSGGGGARWLPVSCAVGGGAVGDTFITEDATNVKFPQELTVPGYSYPLVAVGTGYREKFFVKVYAAAFYVDYSLRLDTEQWKEKIGIDSFDGSSLFDSIFKAPVVKSLSIILVRDVDGKTFVNALNDVIARQIKNPNAEEESSLSTLQNTFLGRNLKQGTSIYLTWLEPKRMLNFVVMSNRWWNSSSKDGNRWWFDRIGLNGNDLLTSFRHISISENQDSRQVDAEIKSATVNYALYDGFFGRSPVSPSLRSSSAQLLEALLLAK